MIILIKMYQNIKMYTDKREGRRFLALRGGPIQRRGSDMEV